MTSGIEVIAFDPLSAEGGSAVKGAGEKRKAGILVEFSQRGG